MRISDWSSDVCSSDLLTPVIPPADYGTISFPEQHEATVFSVVGHRANRVPRDVFRCDHARSEEHTSELQSLMRISYAVFCLKKKNKTTLHNILHNQLLIQHPITKTLTTLNLLTSI